jgi:GNAT superfamily N-acetyltransferase
VDRPGKHQGPQLPHCQYGRLHVAHRNEHPSPGRRSGEILAGTYSALIFADEAGEVFGYTLTDYTRSPMYLRHLFVHKALMKKGYGHELIKHTIAHFAITEIDLDMMVLNEGARGFYKKIGCRVRYLGLRYHRQD